MLQDVWVANAGLSASRKAPVAETSAQELVGIVNANLTGAWPWKGAASADYNSLGLPQRHCANPASAWHTMQGGIQTALPLPAHAAGALLAAKAALPRLAPGGKFFLVDGSGRCALCSEGGAGWDRAWRNTRLPLKPAPRGTSRCCRLGALAPHRARGCALIVHNGMLSDLFAPPALLQQRAAHRRQRSIRGHQARPGAAQGQPGGRGPGHRRGGAHLLARCAGLGQWYAPPAASCCLTLVARRCCPCAAVRSAALPASTCCRPRAVLQHKLHLCCLDWLISVRLQSGLTAAAPASVCRCTWPSPQRFNRPRPPPPLPPQAWLPPTCCCATLTTRDLVGATPAALPLPLRCGAVAALQQDSWAACAHLSQLGWHAAVAPVLLGRSWLPFKQAASCKAAGEAVEVQPTFLAAFAESGHSHPL